MIIDADDIHELDVSGYLCPFPVLKAAKVMRDLKPASVLRITSTDEGSWDDFVHFCKENGHELLHRDKQGGKYIFLLKKANHSKRST